ncbi:MAG: AAA family ATPase, partial [Rubripirellula sp.]
MISEGGMGFRQSDEWEHLPLKAASSIILKSSGPLMQGKLWEEISSDEDGYRDKLTIVVSVNDLRRTSARISRGLSWDTTLRHVINELQAGNALERLTHCRHLIVSFGSEAALWIHFGDPSGAAHASFLFDPGVIEGDHALSVQGTAFGLQSCLTAAVANAVCRDKTPNLETGCEGGLSAMYNLLQQGHGPATEATSGFPAERLAKDIRHPSHRYSRARFTFPDSELPTSWSVLSESAKTSHTSGASDIPFETARLVALRGPIALENLPSVRVGHLLSVDRYETEALRALMNQMRNYRDHDSGSKPLSIGVFGPPGSGKSFGVKQMATEICGKNGWLEFNLSQFASTDDLIGAFHQIRDCVLRQIIPVAFFDEFDSQKLKWLQYLLAPMQDGKFQEGKLTHPIGKCIFVFAGGTSWTFDSFGPHEKASTSAHEEFRHAKGPDFKSRLDGYLNVIGPNQKKTLIPDGDGYEPGPPDLTDVCFPIRRALMLRSELRCDENAKLDMDEGILEAILHAKEFTHGSRSLSKILQPFKNGTTGPFYKSALPPLSQIGMHTDVDEFLKNCNSSTTPTS